MEVCCFSYHTIYPCSVSFWCMFGGRRSSVEIWAKNNLYWFIEGQTHFGMNAKWMSPMQLHTLMGHLHLSGVWVRCGFKNGHQRGMCLKEIGLCAQNLLSILRSIVSIIIGGDLYDRFRRKKSLTLMMNKISIWAPKIIRENGYSWFGFASHLILIMCLIS